MYNKHFLYLNPWKRQFEQEVRRIIHLVAFASQRDQQYLTY